MDPVYLASPLAATRSDAVKNNLLKPEAAAAYMDTSPGNLAQMRYRGLGPKFIKLGARAVRYRLSDIEAYLDMQTRQQTGAA